MSSTPTPTNGPAPYPVKCYSAGMGPPVPATRIEREAEAAARQGIPLTDCCPYPFTEPAGLHFAAVWLVHSPHDTPIYPRPQVI